MDMSNGSPNKREKFHRKCSIENALQERLCKKRSAEKLLWYSCVFLFTHSFLSSRFDRPTRKMPSEAENIRLENYLQVSFSTSISIHFWVFPSPSYYHSFKFAVFCVLSIPEVLLVMKPANIHQPKSSYFWGYRIQFWY